MSQRKSKYGKGEAYDHKFKAGNVGDVLKHCALLAWMDALAGTPRCVVDTHAGAGMHTLGPTGEWQAGIGRIDAQDADTAPGVVTRYLEAVGDKRTANKGGLYPGSPALLRGALGAEDRLILCELAEAPRDRLQAYYDTDTAVTVLGGDGLAGLRAADPEARQLAAFIDPPYVSKDEWTQVAQTVIEVAKNHPTASIAVWYPIKSLMRPQTLAAAVRNAGVPGATIDLLTTPLRLKRRALNGSGLLFVRPPAGLLATLAGAAPWLGEAMAHPIADEWNVNVRSWNASPEQAEDAVEVAS